PILLVHARAMALAGRFDDAQTDLARARRIAVLAFGPRDAWVGVVGTAIGEALILHGDFDVAARTLEESVAILAEAHGPYHPAPAAARAALGAVRQKVRAPPMHAGP